MLLKQLMSSYLADILSEKWQRNPNFIQSRMVAMVKVFSIFLTDKLNVSYVNLSLWVNAVFFYESAIPFLHLGEVYN